MDDAHPDPVLLDRFLAGELPLAAIDSIEQHLETCSACRTRLQPPAPSDPLLDCIREAARDWTPDGSPGGPSTTASPERRDRWEQPPPSQGDLPFIPGYQVIKLLGRGGMGVVYLTRHIGFNRPVAIKTLVAGRFASPEQLTRFRIEAQTLARLQHPHIVRVYDVGVVDQVPYLAMEYLDGGTLAEAARQRRYAPRESAQLVRRLALAVQAAHAQGIIHRDLKPANVLLTEQEGGSGGEEPSASGVSLPPGAFPKIADFGLARWSEAELHLTQSGTAAGSAPYMAPEQVRGEGDGIGPATDVYGLGAVLYELLSGCAPFAGLSVVGICQAVLQDEPTPPRRLQADVPRDLETICLKCLEKDAARRYATAQHLADELGRFLRHETILARPASRWERLARWRRRNPAIAGMLALVFCLLSLLGAVSTVAAAWLYRAERETAALAVAEHQARLQAEAAKARAEAAERESAARLVSSNLLVGNTHWRDRESVHALLWYEHAWRNDILATRAEDQHRLRLAVQLTRYPPLVGFGVSDQPPSDAVWSPGFRRVVLLRPDGAAELWDPYRGERRAIWQHAAAIQLVAADAAGGRFATFSSDRTVRLWQAEDGAAAGGPWTHPADVRCAAFGPDGQILATGAADGRIRGWPPATGSTVLFELDCGTPLADLDFHPGGKSLLSVTDDGHARLWDPGTGQPMCAPLPPPTAAGSSAAGGPVLAGPRFSGNGAYFVMAGANRLELRESAGGTLVRQWAFPAAVRAWSLSDSASRVAVLGADQRLAACFRDAAGTAQPIQIPPVYPAKALCLSGDGRLLATIMGHGRLFVWDLRTVTAVAIAFGPLGRTTHLACSGDGRSILAVSRDNTVRIWELPKADAALEPCPEDFISTAEWQRRESGAQPQATGPSTGGPAITRFSRDGRRRLTVTAGSAVQVWDTASGNAVHPAMQHTQEIPAADLSRDGRRVAVWLSSGSLKLYDADTGDPLGAEISLPVKPSPGGLWFTEDDRSLVLRTERGGWHQFRLPRLDLPADEVSLLLGLLTGERIDEGTQRVIDVASESLTQSPARYLQVWRRWRGIE